MAYGCSNVKACLNGIWMGLLTQASQGLTSSSLWLPGITCSALLCWQMSDSLRLVIHLRDSLLRRLLNLCELQPACCVRTAPPNITKSLFHVLHAIAVVSAAFTSLLSQVCRHFLSADDKDCCFSSSQLQALFSDVKLHQHIWKPGKLYL